MGKKKKALLITICIAAVLLAAALLLSRPQPLGEPDSEAGQALLDALSGISAHRRFRLPTSPVSVIRAQDNYVSIWFRANGRDHDLYLFADGSVLYDDASRSVAYVLDSDAEDAFRTLVNVISLYGTKR